LSIPYSWGVGAIPGLSGVWGLMSEVYIVSGTSFFFPWKASKTPGEIRNITRKRIERSYWMRWRFSANLTTYEHLVNGWIGFLQRFSSRVFGKKSGPEHRSGYFWFLSESKSVSDDCVAVSRLQNNVEEDESEQRSQHVTFQLWLSPVLCRCPPRSVHFFSYFPPIFKL